MIKEQKNNTAPAVLMLMGSRCAYCGPMMQSLTELMKAGKAAELRIVNIEENPALAADLGVRTVPWLQIGPFELAGARSKQELQLWLKRASSFEGINEYLEEILSEGNIDAANKLLQRHPGVLQNIIEIMADAEAKINVRLGVGVIIEDRAETEEFKKVIPRLIEYLSDDDARIRSDACHYLSLTKDSAYIADIEKLLADESEEVRDIAQESLDELR